MPARGGPSLVRVDVRRPPPGALPGSSCWSPDAGRSGHHLPRSPRRRHHRRSPRPPRRWRLASESGCGTIRWSFIHRVRLLAVVRVRVEARHHPLFLFLLCMYRLALMSRLVCLLCSRPLLPPPPAFSDAPRGIRRAGQGTCSAVTADAAGHAGGLPGRDHWWRRRRWRRPWRHHCRRRSGGRQRRDAVPGGGRAARGPHGRARRRRPAAGGAASTGAGAPTAAAAAAAGAAAAAAAVAAATPRCGTAAGWRRPATRRGCCFAACVAGGLRRAAAVGSGRVGGGGVGGGAHGVVGRYVWGWAWVLLFLGLSAYPAPGAPAPGCPPRRRTFSYPSTDARGGEGAIRRRSRGWGLFWVKWFR